MGIVMDNKLDANTLHVFSDVVHTSILLGTTLPSFYT